MLCNFAPNKRFWAERLDAANRTHYHYLKMTDNTPLLNIFFVDKLLPPAIRLQRHASQEISATDGHLTRQHHFPRPIPTSTSNDSDVIIEGNTRTPTTTYLQNFSDDNNGNELLLGGSYERGEFVIVGEDDDDDDAATFAALNTMNDVRLLAVILCDALGVLCIILNAFVIASLLMNRRRVLSNVFYVLVLHCAVVDMIRGGCLVAWGMPHLLLVESLNTMRARLFALKINQFTLMILRSCNLLTIFNLLVFTTNEFIVIKYPLHYRRYFRRRTVLFILAMSWLISLLFGVGSAFSNFFESAHSVIIIREDDLTINASRYYEEFKEDGLNGVEPSRAKMKRREIAGLPMNVICMLTIFILCYICLFTVLICYGTILRTIRQFHLTEKRSGAVGGASVSQANPSGVSSSAPVTPAMNGSSSRTASLYHHRYHHDALKKTSTATIVHHHYQPWNVAANTMAGTLRYGGCMAEPRVSTPSPYYAALQHCAVNVCSSPPLLSSSIAVHPTPAITDSSSFYVAAQSQRTPPPQCPSPSPTNGGGGSSSNNYQRQQSLPQQQPKHSTAVSVDEALFSTTMTDRIASTPHGSLHHQHHRDNTTTTNNNNECGGHHDGGETGTSERRCNSHRKWKSHLMSRHKYLIVIGSVLFVDILFLFPYSAIQMVAFLHLHNVLAASSQASLIRWGLQVMIGVHSVFQPLCYFRMNEFRRMACCGRRGAGGRYRRRRPRCSRSSVTGSAGGAGATSTWRQSFRGSKSNSHSHLNFAAADQATDSCAAATPTALPLEASCPRHEQHGNSIDFSKAVAADVSSGTTSKCQKIHHHHLRDNDASVTTSFGACAAENKVEEMDAGVTAHEKRHHFNKNRKMSKNQNIVDIGVHVNALRRISSSSLVLQSACIITVEDVDAEDDSVDMDPAPGQIGSNVDGTVKPSERTAEVIETDFDGVRNATSSVAASASRPRLEEIAKETPNIFRRLARHAVSFSGGRRHGSRRRRRKSDAMFRTISTASEGPTTLVSNADTVNSWLLIADGSNGRFRAYGEALSVGVNNRSRNDSYTSTEELSSTMTACPTAVTLFTHDHCSIVSP